MSQSSTPTQPDSRKANLREVLVFLLLLVISVPFLQPIFNTHFMSGREWAVVLSLALVPAASEELTKLYLRWSDRNRAA